MVHGAQYASALVSHWVRHMPTAHGAELQAVQYCDGSSAPRPPLRQKPMLHRHAHSALASHTNVAFAGAALGQGSHTSASL